MKRSRPCVLIYNPISGHGHLDSWNALFVGFLLERGHRILVLTPDRKALESRLAQRKLADHSMLHVLDWNAPRFQLNNLPLIQSRVQKLWRWWLSYGKSYAEQYPESRIVPGMSRRTRLKKRMFQTIVPPLYKLSYAVHSAFSRQLSQQREDPDDPAEIHYFEPVDMAYRMKAALEKSPWRPDCVLNMYMDMYKTGVEAWRQFASVCRLPWGGIRFVPSDPPPREGYYSLPSLRGMCFLDESICQAYNSSFSDKYFQYLPDITTTELPDGTCQLAEEIACRAAGRKIVFLGGSIVGKKNIARWSELIALADPEKWFFAQVGEIHVSTFSQEDIAAFERLYADSPENLFLHPFYLSDDREFNSVIQMSDLIFAAYRDFPFSSNMLGKAAYFEKPILVSDGYLMGDRVRRYGIGLSVHQDDVQGMVDALERLVNEPVSSQNFSTYREAFNDRTASDRLETFINHLLTY